MHSWRLVALVPLVVASLATVAEAAHYRQTLNVVYAETDGVGLLMDVFAPAKSGGSGHGLGIVCVCSGGWTSERSMVDAHRSVGVFDALCDHGYTVFAVRPGDYSVFTGEQMLAHVRRGIRYVKAHASEYGIDPQRLGLVGVSAGGHLACLAATRAESGDPNSQDALNRLDTQVSAVGVFCPATDFLDWNGKKYGLELLGWRLAFSDGVAGKTDQQKDDAARAISPVYHVKAGLPPFYIMHGDADPVIPFSQSQKLTESLRKAGVPVELTARNGGGHSWPTMREDYGRLASWFDSKLPVR
jgi:acetyl esterase/lipase